MVGVPNLLELLGLAAIDSVNLLSFAVLAGLWLSTGGGSRKYFLRAIRYTGGAYLGIAGLAAVVTWVIGNNQEFVRALFDNVWVMLAVAVVGGVLTVMGLRAPSEAREESFDGPLTQGVLERFGLLSTGIVLGVVQSATSVPYAAGMVIISFAETAVWQQIVQILFFAFVATLPCLAMIIVLTRIRSSRISSATAYIDRFMGYGRIAGRYLSIGVGLALVVFGAVRVAQISGVL